MKTIRPIQFSDTHPAIGMTSRSAAWFLKRTIERQHRASSRRGAAMVFALIALLVTSMMIGSLLRTAGMSHRQLKRDEFRLQASYLADAGYERARAMLSSQPDYTSEEWKLSEEELSRERTAIVTIRVGTKADDSSERIITATALYPVGHPDAVRVTRQLPIQ